VPKALAALALTAVLFAPAVRPAAPDQGAGGFRVREVLPADGLIVSSVVAIRDQSVLNPPYYLADEAVLGLGRKTDAVFARYKAGTGEALVLAVAYPAAGDVAKVYARFGGDFFSGKFEAGSSLFLERLETGDWGAAARTGRVLVVVLEAPDRAGCEGLLKRLLEQALAADR
jgi:hypothetical protein